MCTCVCLLQKLRCQSKSQQRYAAPTPHSPVNGETNQTSAANQHFISGAIWPSANCVSLKAVNQHCDPPPPLPFLLKMSAFELAFWLRGVAWPSWGRGWFVDRSLLISCCISFDHSFKDSQELIQARCSDIIRVHKCISFSLALCSGGDPEHQLRGDGAQLSFSSSSSPGLQAVLRVPGQVVRLSLRSELL